MKASMLLQLRIAQDEAFIDECHRKMNLLMAALTRHHCERLRAQLQEALKREKKNG